VKDLRLCSWLGFAVHWLHDQPLVGPELLAQGMPAMSRPQNWVLKSCSQAFLVQAPTQFL
jgi:hypothetical protein